jgi:hypothetical protein
MYCDSCGKQLPENANFCPGCGKSTGAPAPKAWPGRVARHIRVVGILWLIYGVLHLLAGIAIWTVGALVLPHVFFGPWHMMIFGWPFPLFMGGMVSGMGALLVVGAAAACLAGWGLLERAAWARMLALAVAVLALLNLPWGTALGIYTLWVLLPETSAQEYRRAAGSA